jgi:hypothetical protein
MDILHKVNLHIFVQFQDYVSRHDENCFGKPIYDLTQVDMNSGRYPEAAKAWDYYQQGYFAGHSRPPEGHGEQCYYCHEACNSFAGNPGEWPVGLCHPDDPGKLKWHHVGCVSDRLHGRVSIEKE